MGPALYAVTALSLVWEEPVFLVLYYLLKVCAPVSALLSFVISSPFHNFIKSP